MCIIILISIDFRFTRKTNFKRTRIAFLARSATKFKVTVRTPKPLRRPKAKPESGASLSRPFSFFPYRKSKDAFENPNNFNVDSRFYLGSIWCPSCLRQPVRLASWAKIIPETLARVASNWKFQPFGFYYDFTGTNSWTAAFNRSSFHTGLRLIFPSRGFSRTTTTL